MKTKGQLTKIKRFRRRKRKLKRKYEDNEN